MGNEQSGPFAGGAGTSSSTRGGVGGDASSPTTSMGMPASFSFLAKKRNSTKSGAGMMGGSIVVVNEGASGQNTQADSAKYPDLQRIKEIPHFLPLLRSVLPGYRDPPEVHQKIGSKHFLSFLHRLQHHFRQCSQTVSAEQGRMFARIVEIDQLIASLLKKTAISSKKLDTLNAELKKAEFIEDQLEATQIMLQDLAKSVDELNQLLSPEDRLSPIQIAFTPILTERRTLAESGGKLISASTTAPATSQTAEIDPRKVSETRVVDRK